MLEAAQCIINPRPARAPPARCSGASARVCYCWVPDQTASARLPIPLSRKSRAVSFCRFFQRRRKVQTNCVDFRWKRCGLHPLKCLFSPSYPSLHSSFLFDSCSVVCKHCFCDASISLRSGGWGWGETPESMGRNKRPLLSCPTSLNPVSTSPVDCAVAA